MFSNSFNMMNSPAYSGQKNLNPNSLPKDKTIATGTKPEKNKFVFNASDAYQETEKGYELQVKTAQEMNLSKPKNKLSIIA